MADLVLAKITDNSSEVNLLHYALSKMCKVCRVIWDQLLAEGYTCIHYDFAKMCNVCGVIWDQLLVEKYKVQKHPQRKCSVKKCLLTNFTKFTGKHLCRSLFLIKLQDSACNFIKKETLTQVFSCEFCEISKNTFFLQNTSGRSLLTVIILE